MAFSVPLCIVNRLKMFWTFVFRSKLYIPSMYYKHIEKWCSSKPFGQTKNWLVSGRLACTSSKTELLNKIEIQIFIPEFSI